MSKKLFIINSLGQGGAERVVASLANHMSQNNEVYVLTLKESKSYKLDPRIKYYSLDIDKCSRSGLLFNLKKIVEKLNNSIKSFEVSGEFDVITSHLPLSHLICKKSEYSDRIHYVIHTVYSRKFNKFKIVRGIGLRWIYKDTNIVSVSHGVANEMKLKFKVKSKSMRVINNPIDKKKIDEMKKEKINLNKEYILFVGRLEKIKNVDLILKAYSISKINNKYNMMILGDGQEMSYLTTYVEELDITSKVKFMGWVDNPYKWMANSELLVSFSEYEAFPMNLIEALACNTKTVSGNCDYGPREILIDELLPYLVDSFDVEELAKKMELAIESYPKDIEKYSLEYDINVISNKYLTLN